MKKFDLIAIGRAAVDLNAVEYNRPMEETKTFAKYVGGSPANIAIGSARLGQKVGFIGKIADDQLGNYVKLYMKEAGIDTSNLVVDKDGHKTGLTFTEILSPTECDILMYRDQVADLYLTSDEINGEYISQANMLVISGTGLAQSPSREAIIKSMFLAKKLGVKVVFELDYRPYTWKNAEETSIYYKIIANHADVIIGTRDEYDVLENGIGNTNDETVAELFKHDAQLIVIKVGSKGSYAYTKEGKIYRGYAYETKVLKSFGAGDSFAAAFLYAYSKNLGIETALKFGGASASIVISKLSSSDAMPTVEEIENFLKTAKIKEVE
ncbi:5-dehydro-2-deoxygluconokinase [Ligilactobacillus sp. WILCCON 0076]|uniref:5-dehydro-2-deoxygluconokinase n=1 Tax=Ligilactobacillus ubinensis TaxID=2876789 RepID=A0A9X2FLD0_9LACO|nr:5-dehydro-2-deoxygluconokinase [Ligilactobacillus ubinensis]MCP0887495.1 5-dehydro-2-deoxygluconokinase [Ligilactobacillus ubinensis]